MAPDIAAQPCVKNKKSDACINIMNDLDSLTDTKGYRDFISVYSKPNFSLATNQDGSIFIPRLSPKQGEVHGTLLNKKKEVIDGVFSQDLKPVNIVYVSPDGNAHFWGSMKVDPISKQLKFDKGTLMTATDRLNTRRISLMSGSFNNLKNLEPTPQSAFVNPGESFFFEFKTREKANTSSVPVVTLDKYTLSSGGMTTVYSEVHDFPNTPGSSSPDPRGKYSLATLLSTLTDRIKVDPVKMTPDVIKGLFEKLKTYPKFDYNK